MAPAEHRFSRLLGAAEASAGATCPNEAHRKKGVSWCFIDALDNVGASTDLGLFDKHQDILNDARFKVEFNS